MRFTSSILLLTLLTGCPDNGSNGTPDACTEMGCEDGYTIEVVGPGGSEVGDLWVAVTLGGVTVEADCAAGAMAAFDGFSCGLGMIQLHYVEETVDLVVEATDGELGWGGTIEPEYAEVYPNGPDCPPVCLQGSEILELAELGGGD